MDYRNSHLDPSKGLSYDKTFYTEPYRKIVWNWEKDVLDGIIDNYFQENNRQRYLDFACGTGRILHFLENHFTDSYGVDVSESMLSIGRAKKSKSLFYLADLTKENFFPECFFNLITAFRFFLNAQPELREEALSVLSRIIETNGFLVFNIHMNKGCVLDRVVGIYRRIRKDNSPGLNTLGFKEVSSLTQKHNFKIIQTFHYGVFPIYQEGFHFLIKQIDQIERIFSKIPFFLPLSRYVIYLCQPMESHN